MHRNQLDGLITFLCVAEHRSFSAAAVRLGVSPSAVSQSIRTLELRLGTALFNRTTRSLGLTEMGARYLERVAPAVRDLVAAQEDLDEAGERPSGLLRLNVPRIGYMILLQPLLRDFLDAYPAITLEIAIENSLVDIVGRGFDAGIRLGDLVEQDMVGVKIGPAIAVHVVGAPEYLERAGIPGHPRELLAHDCIRFRHSSSGQIERWRFAKEEKGIELTVSGRLIVNDSGALVQAALDGLGLAYMINGTIERFIAERRLIRVLAEWSPPLPGLILYYPSRQRVPPKLRALIDFLRSHRSVLCPPVDSILR